MTEKTWHEILRDKLQPKAMMPKPEAWQNVQAALAKKRRRRLIAWWSSTAVACAVVGFGGGLLWQGTGAQKGISNASVAAVKAEQPIEQNNVPTVAKDEVVDFKVLDDNKTSKRARFMDKSAMGKSAAISSFNELALEAKPTEKANSITANITAIAKVEMVQVENNESQELKTDSQVAENNKLIAVMLPNSDLDSQSNILKIQSGERTTSYYALLAAGKLSSISENSENVRLLAKDKRSQFLYYGLGLGIENNKWLVGIDYRFQKIGYNRLFTAYTEQKDSVNYFTTYTLEDSYMPINSAGGSRIDVAQTWLPFSVKQQVWGATVARKHKLKNERWRVISKAQVGLGLTNIEILNLPNSLFSQVSKNAMVVNEDYISVVYGAGMGAEYALRTHWNIGVSYAFNRQGAINNLKQYVYNWHGLDFNLRYSF